MMGKKRRIFRDLIGEEIVTHKSYFSALIFWQFVQSRFLSVERWRISSILADTFKKPSTTSLSELRMREWSTGTVTFDRENTVEVLVMKIHYSYERMATWVKDNLGLGNLDEAGKGRVRI